MFQHLTPDQRDACLFSHSLRIAPHTVPVLAVRLQACDQLTRPWFHADGLVFQGDDVGGDFRPVAVWLVPLEEEAGGRGVTRLRGGRQLQEGEGGDRVGVCRGGPETHLVAVRPSACLIHRLRWKKQTKKTEKSQVRGVKEIGQAVQEAEDRKDVEGGENTDN